MLQGFSQQVISRKRAFVERPALTSPRHPVREVKSQVTYPETSIFCKKLASMINVGPAISFFSGGCTGCRPVRVISFNKLPMAPHWSFFGL